MEIPSESAKARTSTTRNIRPFPFRSKTFPRFHSIVATPHRHAARLRISARRHYAARCCTAAESGAVMHERFFMVRVTDEENALSHHRYYYKQHARGCDARGQKSD
jgi:hypothetical protein